MQTITHPDWADAQWRADTEAEATIIEHNRTVPWCRFVPAGDGLVDVELRDGTYVETIEVPADPRHREATLLAYLGW